MKIQNECFLEDMYAIFASQLKGYHTSVIKHSVALFEIKLRAIFKIWL